MTIFRTMFPVYGRLVLMGVYTVEPDDKAKKQVPEVYVPYVLEWIASYQEKREVDS